MIFQVVAKMLPSGFYVNLFARLLLLAWFEHLCVKVQRLNIENIKMLLAYLSQLLG